MTTHSEEEEKTASEERGKTRKNGNFFLPATPNN
jgi:hypothetical protein